jgi:hypothetical protein
MKSSIQYVVICFKFLDFFSVWINYLFSTMSITTLNVTHNVWCRSIEWFVNNKLVPVKKETFVV